VVFKNLTGAMSNKNDLVETKTGYSTCTDICRREASLLLERWRAMDLLLLAARGELFRVRDLRW
jgi:hypothetical protein